MSINHKEICAQLLRRFPLEPIGLIMDVEEPQDHKTFCTQLVSKDFNPCKVRVYQYEFKGTHWEFIGIKE